MINFNNFLVKFAHGTPHQHTLTTSCDDGGVSFSSSFWAAFFLSCSSSLSVISPISTWNAKVHHLNKYGSNRNISSFNLIHCCWSETINLIRFGLTLFDQKHSFSRIHVSVMISLDKQQKQIEQCTKTN